VHVTECVIGGILTPQNKTHKALSEMPLHSGSKNIEVPSITYSAVGHCAQMSYVSQECVK